MSVRFIALIVGSLIAVLASACSVPQNPAGPTPDRSPAVEFSAEEKAAARSLSIGNTTTLESATDPYQFALECSVAVDGLIATLRQSASLSDQQQAAIEQVRGVYSSRVQATAAAKNKGRAEIEKDRGELLAADEDPAERARTAIGCIQRLT